MQVILYRITGGNWEMKKNKDIDHILVSPNKLKVLSLLLCISLIGGMLSACGSSYDRTANDTYYGGAGEITESMSASLGVSADSVTAGLGGVFDFNTKGESESNGSVHYAPSSNPQESIEQIPEKNGENTSSESILDTINFEKLVYKANFVIESKSYDDSVNSLKELISSYDGIIGSESYEDSSYYGWDTYRYDRGYRRYNCVVRIPTPNFDNFTQSVGSIGHISTSNSYVENISREYYDTKAYLESYENQLINLQKMYDYATTIEEMMSLEARISNVQAEILKLKTQIQSMDMDVAYSTINISVKEVVDYSEPVTPEEERTFIYRLKNTMIDSWENFLDNCEDFLFWVIYNIWGIVIWVCIIVVGVKLIKTSKKKYRLKREEKKARKNSKSAKGNKENNKADEIDETGETSETGETGEIDETGETGETK